MYEILFWAISFRDLKASSNRVERMTELESVWRLWVFFALPLHKPVLSVESLTNSESYKTNSDAERFLFFFVKCIISDKIISVDQGHCKVKCTWNFNTLTISRTRSVLLAFWTSGAYIIYLSIWVSTYLANQHLSLHLSGKTISSRAT